MDCSPFFKIGLAGGVGSFVLAAASLVLAWVYHCRNRALVSVILETIEAGQFQNGQHPSQHRPAQEQEPTDNERTPLIPPSNQDSKPWWKRSRTQPTPPPTTQVPHFSNVDLTGGATASGTASATASAPTSATASAQ